MLPELNPYRPGLAPPELTGREEEVGYFQLLVDRAKAGGGLDRSVLFTGLRGMGKTALLSELVRIAELSGWLHVEIEGQHSRDALGFRRQLGAALDAALVRFRMRHQLGHVVEQARETVGRFSEATQSAASDYVLIPAATGLLEVDLETLVQQLSDVTAARKAVFVLFVDELQGLDREVLSALLAIQHKAQQRSWYFYLVGTGAPTLTATLARLRPDIGRLFRHLELGALSDEAARDALTIPARRNGVEFTDDALSYLVEASQGYPFQLQQFGQAVWDLAESSPIEPEAALEAIQAGEAELDESFFAVWWDQATEPERRYATAVAVLAPSGESVPVAKLAELLSVPLTRLSKTRAALINKGMIYVPSRGLIAFTVPGMSPFVSRVSNYLADPEEYNPPEDPEAPTPVDYPAADPEGPSRAEYAAEYPEAPSRVEHAVENSVDSSPVEYADANPEGPTPVDEPEDTIPLKYAVATPKRLGRVENPAKPSPAGELLIDFDAAAPIPALDPEPEPLPDPHLTLPSMPPQRASTRDPFKYAISEAEQHLHLPNPRRQL
jgi:DNA polymerase III delta prime subunit